MLKSETSAQQSSRHILTWLASLVLGFALLALTCSVSFLWANRPLVSAPIKVAEDILGRMVAIGLRVEEEKQADGQTQLIVQGDRRASRLVMAERRFRHSFEYSTKWKGSTKTLVLEAEFKAYAGVDFSRGPIRLRLGQGVESLNLTDVRGRGALIACELVGPVDCTLVDNGYWNKLQPGEVTHAIDMMKLDARSAMIEKTDFLRVAEQNYLDYVRGKGPRPHALPAGLR